MIEVDLCGHATVAAAHTLWSEGVVPGGKKIEFGTKSGLLTAARHGDLIELDFPATPPVVGSKAALQAIRPDFRRLAELRTRGVIVTCRADTVEFDFLSRFFAPAAGVDEDPVTGSAHCALAPFWAERLEKPTMTAYQASSRGGHVHVTVRGDRVLLGGQAVTVLRGELT